VAFTFAHARKSGWDALEGALREPGLSLTAAIPVEAEGSNGFHSDPGNLKWNGLFVCRKGRTYVQFDESALRQASRKRSISNADRTNLGRALAVATRHVGKGGNRGD